MVKKKFRSIIREVVFLPLTVLLVIMVIMVISVIISYVNVEKQMIESNVNALQVSINQLDSQFGQMENDFIQYITSYKSFRYLKNMDENTTATQYFKYQQETLDWLSKQYAAYEMTDGAFAYYKNMDLLMFRGDKNTVIRGLIKELLKNSNIQPNHWGVVELQKKQYLLMIRNYQNLYCGYWIPLDTLTGNFGLEEGTILGEVYVMDRDFDNTIEDKEVNAVLKEKGRDVRKIKIEGQRYSNYTVASQNKDVTFGILIPWLTVFYKIPLFNKLIFITAILSLALIPGIVHWLHTRIAKPLRIIDDAMESIREGDTEYRIPLHDKKHYDEFDRSMLHFNRMMDDLNELSFNLYKTKIREQRAELKYISQQIRPHFILNALNIIYTYDISEFHLIKKMVLYLSEYFQYVVNLRVDFVEVEKEFRHVENYLKIQKERYPHRFEYKVEAEEKVKDCMLPPLIIQTFTENCIKYAMKNDEVLEIIITAQEKDGKLKIAVEDTGNGFSKSALDKIQTFLDTREYQKHLGVGIQNAIERMDILYQERIEVTVSNTISGGAMVEITLPMEI